MNETLFDDALEYFQKGNVNPINLINLFDEYRVSSLVTSPTKFENNELIPNSINSISKYKYINI